MKTPKYLFKFLICWFGVQAAEEANFNKRIEELTEKLKEAETQNSSIENEFQKALNDLQIKEVVNIGGKLQPTASCLLTGGV